MLATSLRDNGGQDVVCSVTHVLPAPLLSAPLPGERSGGRRGRREEEGRRRRGERMEEEEEEDVGGGDCCLRVCVCVCTRKCVRGEAQTARGNLMCVPGDV